MVLGLTLGSNSPGLLLFDILNDSAKAIVSAWLLGLVKHEPIRLNAPRQFAVFLGIAAGVVPLLSALLSASLYQALGEPFWGTVGKRFLRDSLAQAVVTPVLLYGCRVNYRRVGWLSKETLLLFSGLLAALYYSLVVHHGTFFAVTLYTPIPFLIWAAVRLRPPGAAAAAALVAVAGIIGARTGTGIFLGEPRDRSELSIQLLTLVLCVPLLGLSLLNTERMRRAGRPRALLDAAPVAILMPSEADGDGVEPGAAAEKGSFLDEVAHLHRVAEMGHMTASVAHELAQPLSAILSNAQAAQRFSQAPVPDLEEIKAALEEIIEDDQRARSIVQSMRQVLKKHTLTAHLVDLNEVVGNTGHLIRHDAMLRGIQIQWKLWETPIWVRGDEIPLQQVIQNLMVNGMDAMQHLSREHRVLRVETAISDTLGCGVVSVADCGPGITAQDQPKLFTPFFTTKREGLGLGLSICQSIIHSLGGQIHVQNGFHRGATFQVLLPLSASVEQSRNHGASAA